MTMWKRPLSGLLACFGFAIFFLGPAASAAEPECKCSSPGQSYLVGTCVCLERPGGARELACCGKVLNNPSWRFTGKGCPIAGTEPAGYVPSSGAPHGGRQAMLPSELSHGAGWRRERATHP